MAGRLHHATLLAGSAASSVGALAAALVASSLCTAPTDGDACDACRSCRQRFLAQHPDLVVLRPNDKGLINVAAVRQMTAQLGTRPQLGARRVVHLVDADCLNAAAQNALLKVLEEPPGACLFVLQLRRLASLLPTLRSRCLCLRLVVTDADAPSAGLAAELVPLVAAWAGETALLEAAPGAWRGLQALQPQAEQPTACLHAAAELGGDANTYAATLALLEVLLRDALAERHGASAAQLHAQGRTRAALPDVWRQQATAGLAALRQVRRQGPIPVNRTLALESVLLILARHAPPSVGV